MANNTEILGKIALHSADFPEANTVYQESGGFFDYSPEQIAHYLRFLEALCESKPEFVETLSQSIAVHTSEASEFATALGDLDFASLHDLMDTHIKALFAGYMLVVVKNVAWDLLNEAKAFLIHEFKLSNNFDFDKFVRFCILFLTDNQ